jgi:hypothetical protein
MCIGEFKLVLFAASASFVDLQVTSDQSKLSLAINDIFDKQSVVIAKETLRKAEQGF